MVVIFKSAIYIFFHIFDIMQFTNYAISAMWLCVAFLLADSLMSQYLANYHSEIRKAL